MLIDARSIQKALATYNRPVKVDGVIGVETRAAIEAVVVEKVGPRAKDWTSQRQSIAFQQIVLQDNGFPPGEIDGMFGPQTQYALERWQNFLRDAPVAPEDIAHQKKIWPRERDAAKFFGAVGKNHVRLKSPYPLVLSWDLDTKISEFVVNAKIKDSTERVLLRVKEHYGLSEIRRLRLDRFGGCFNPRRKRGGSTWSMHAYAAAIDWDTQFNEFRWGRDRAALARPEYEAWWSFWEDEGWVSLGRERNYDWQHVQAARF